MKYLELKENQKEFVLKNYSEHWNDEPLKFALNLVLNPNDILKIDARLASIQFGYYGSIGKNKYKDKLQFLKDVSICIVEDAKEKEWFELANNFEMFIWFCDIILSERKPIKNEPGVKINPHFDFDKYDIK